MEALARSLFLAILGCALCDAALPPYIKPCKRSSNLADCIKANIEAAKPHMGKGIPELSLVPLDPWVFPSIKMNIQVLRLDIYDVHVWKMDTLVVKEVDFNLDDGIFNIKYNIPYFWGECKYDMAGNLFAFRVDGDGYSNGSITDADITLRLRGKPKVVDGKNYMEFEKSGFQWIIKGGATVYFRDIFPGNPVLSDQFNKVVTLQAVPFFYLIRPIMEVIVSEWAEKSVKGVFSNYPLDELFVD